MTDTPAHIIVLILYFMQSCEYEKGKPSFTLVNIHVNKPTNATAYFRAFTSGKHPSEIVMSIRGIYYNSSPYSTSPTLLTHHNKANIILRLV